MSTQSLPVQAWSEGQLLCCPQVPPRLPSSVPTSSQALKKNAAKQIQSGRNLMIVSLSKKLADGRAMPGTKQPQQLFNRALRPASGFAKPRQINKRADRLSGEKSGAYR
jgi:hypothetical protein